MGQRKKARRPFTAPFLADGVHPSLCFGSVSLDEAENFLHSRRANVASLRSEGVRVHPEYRSAFLRNQSSASAGILNSDTRNWVLVSTPGDSGESKWKHAAKPS
jgi:hypothetical protein